MKVILMDIDDTLLDFDKCSYLAIKEALKECNWIMEDDFFDKFTVLNNRLWQDFACGKIEKKVLMNSRWKTLFEQEKINVNHEGFDEVFQKYLSQQAVLIDGAIEVLEYLSSQYDLYTASNGVTAGQINRLKKADIYKYFKGMFISEKIGYPKPRKEFFDYCFEYLKCNKEDIMIIGDSIEADIKGGRNAGIKTCWANLKNKDKTIETDYEIHNLFQIKEIL